MCPPLNFYGKAPTEAALAELMGYARVEGCGVGAKPDAVVTVEAVDEAEEKRRRQVAEINFGLYKEHILDLPKDLQAKLYQWMHDALGMRIYK